MHPAMSYQLAQARAPTCTASPSVIRPPGTACRSES